MAKLLVNELDLFDLIESYRIYNDSFRIINKTKNGPKWSIKFVLDGLDCVLDAYVKTDCINFIPTGKNIELCNKVIDFLKEKSIDADVPSNTISVDCKKSDSEKLINDIKNDEIAKIEYQKDNHFKLKGYYGDIVNLNVYDNKLVIQAKPLCLYGAVISYLGKYIDISFIKKDIHSYDSIDNNTNELLINRIKQCIGNCYEYMDAQMLDSLKSSYQLINMYEISNSKLSDYSGILVGAFKALEGYLRKVLVQKYCYRFERGKAFEMFNKNSNTFIDDNSNITSKAKEHLHKLYSIYNQKRNVYLHGSATSTVIIKKFIDAKSIMDEIMGEICISFNEFFK